MPRLDRQGKLPAYLTRQTATRAENTPFRIPMEQKPRTLPPMRRKSLCAAKGSRHTSTSIHRSSPTLQSLNLTQVLSVTLHVSY